MWRPLERIRFLADHVWSPRHMSEYLDGELPESGRARIERHVRDCHHCHELLERLRAMVASLRGIGAADAGHGDHVASEVLAGFRERNEAEGGESREHPG